MPTCSRRWTSWRALPRLEAAQNSPREAAGWKSASASKCYLRNNMTVRAWL